MIALFISCLVCAALPALMFVSNLRLFGRAPKDADAKLPAVSVLIPARDEERTIAGAIQSVLATDGIAVECIVLDDHSSDETASIVQDLARKDPRVCLQSAPELPPRWNGKQHACHVLSLHASHDILCFVDADVRLTPDALPRIVSFLHASGASLVSGFPRQQTGTWLEALLLPLIHFVLLGFLPIGRMRQSVNPAYAAACGQLMMARRADYRASGGHAAIRSSMHDGLQLPRAFRLAGFRTDIFDATDVAVCRMYTNASDVWSGLAKNATEGLGAPSRIVPFTMMLLLGQVVPLLVAPWYPWFALIAFLGWWPRLRGVQRFQQPGASALLHSAGVILLVTIQWYALARKVLGKPPGWKNRVYAQP